MKRFSLIEDREFEIGGEVFEWIYPYWEDIADTFDKDAKRFEEEADTLASVTVRETLADYIERIQLFLKPEDRERWVTLTKRRGNPVPHAQYSQLYQWLLEVTSAPTPTEPSSQSPDGQQVIAAT